MEPSVTEHQIRRHVTARFAKRVKQHRVDSPVREARRLHAQVSGFDVEVQLGEDLTSRCTCVYGTACEHVGAVLHHWMRHPDDFQVAVSESIDLPDHPKALSDWLFQHERGLLDIEVHDLLGGGWLPPDHPLWRAAYRDLALGLDVLDVAVSEGRISAEDALAPLMEPVSQRVRARRRRRRSVERASEWRSQPPKEPALQRLWKAAHDRVVSGRLAGRPAGVFGRCKVLEGEQLEVTLSSMPYHPVVLPISDDMFDRLGTHMGSEVAGAVLDAVVGTVQPDVRTAVLEVLSTPPWERALLQLDGALALEGPASATQIGWRVELFDHAPVSVAFVGLTPYKRRSGFRSKKMAPGSASALPTAADRAAFGLKEEAPAVVLEQLVGHGRVIDEDGNLLRVKRGILTVRVTEEDDGFTLGVESDGQPVVLPEAGVPVHRGLGAVAVDRVVTVFSVGPALKAVLAMVGRFGRTFPSEARGPLLQRLTALERAIPLALEGELQGQAELADARPCLLLDPFPDGAMEIRVWVAPLTGGPRYAPGVGPVEVARTVDGVRRFVRRDLAAEPDAVLEVLSRYEALPQMIEWEATVEDPETALNLIWALREANDLRLLWPKKKVVVKGEAGASAVRAKAQRKRDWFGLEGALTVDDSTVGLTALLKAIRANQQFVRLDDGSWLRLADGLRKALRAAAQIGTDEDVVRLPPLAAARAMLALEEAGGDTMVPDELTDLTDRIRQADHLELRPPSGLAATLRDYQLVGFTWLRRLSLWAPGGILADEMGLGKTLQALALLLERGGPALVVAPASVNVNWQREAARFAPSLRVELYRGGRRKDQLTSLPDVLITSYELLTRDVESLCEIRFETVVFDEAQALKNPRTKRSRAARALDTAFALALTGTPVENDLVELWSLMRVTVPGALGPREHFHERFGKKLMAAQSIGGGNLGAVIRPFLLRRTKREVAPELPAREEVVEWVDLAPPERVVYDRLRLAAVKALSNREQPGRMDVLAALTRLRQVACAARLIDSEAPPISSKLHRMVARVEEAVQNGGAVLVFSQFTRLLDLAQDALASRGFRHVRLDGSTAMKKRQLAIDSFQAGEADVFLISLKAGGTGLNLTAANTVIHLDPWWNPAAEDQASDRAHRIGQTQPVTVVRLVSAGTVEEQVLALHDEKRALAAKVFEGAAGTLALRSTDLLALLGDDPS